MSIIQKLQRKKEEGFTLVELMIVVVIIGILAAIAIPQFIKFQLKTKHGETGLVSKGILTAENATMQKYGVYGAVGDMPRTLVGSIPTGEKTAWYTAGGGSQQCAPQGTWTTGPCMIGFAPSGKTYFVYNVRIGSSMKKFVSSTVDGDLGTNAGYPCGSGPNCLGTANLAIATPGNIDITLGMIGDLDNDGVPSGSADGNYTANDEVLDLLPTPEQYGESIF